jgi:hypothetical protein
VVERITYQNAENGYTVARLAPERAESEAEAARGEDRLVTVVGTLADLPPGEAIAARRGTLSGLQDICLVGNGMVATARMRGTGAG